MIQDIIEHLPAISVILLGIKDKPMIQTTEPVTTSWNNLKIFPNKCAIRKIKTPVIIIDPQTVVIPKLFPVEIITAIGAKAHPIITGNPNTYMFSYS